MSTNGAEKVKERSGTLQVELMERIGWDQIFTNGAEEEKERAHTLEMKVRIGVSKGGSGSGDFARTSQMYLR